MTDKHRTPQYQRNARVIRARVRSLWRQDQAAQCWRCRGPIPPGMPFDVGHVEGAGGSALSDLAPEHRHGTPTCQGNRSHGGTLGAQRTNQRRSVPRGQVTTWPL